MVLLEVNSDGNSFVSSYIILKLIWISFPVIISNGCTIINDEQNTDFDLDSVLTILRQKEPSAFAVSLKVTLQWT